MVLKVTVYGLTPEDEKKTYEEMVNLIQHPDIEVLHYSEDENSYGEFLFITLYDKKAKMTFTYFGLGYHELFDRPVITFVGFKACFDEEYYRKKNENVHLAVLIGLMTRRYYECEAQLKKQAQRSEKGKLAENLAEEFGCDLDGIKSDLDDMYGE